MRVRSWKPILILVIALGFLFANETQAAPPVISGYTPASGPVGTVVTIGGSSFGAAQGTSTVTFNGTAGTPTSWNDTQILVPVPAGATTGPLTVTVGGVSASIGNFTVGTLPASWADGDVGTVGIAGSASYANGTYTVNGSGQWIWDVADGMHFVYQPLSGDGAIVARVLSMNVAGGSLPQPGVMIRETLGAGSAHAFLSYRYSGGPLFQFLYRPTTGGLTSYQQIANTPLPYWMKLARSGNTLSSYVSSDGVNWTQVGTSQTITMVANVYIGLAVSADTNTALATATFDNVSISSTAAPAPVIGSVSATTGPIGSQVVITGSGFGALQGSSAVMLNGVSVPISSWSNTSITITIPTWATSGPLAVLVGPSMNASNPITFTVLPTGWLDQDVGSVGLTGSATYANGIFTVKGAGAGLWGAADAFHFVYQPMSGDGYVTARVTSISTGIYTAGVEIRESLDPSAKSAFMEFVSNYNSPNFNFRTTTGGSTGQSWLSSMALPCWLKVARSGSTVTAYVSTGGVSWTQVGPAQTISMAQTVYVGLGVNSGSTTALATATFDNVSVSSAATPVPVITGLSVTTGSIGSQVVITGSNFGASQGSSVVRLNAAPMTVNAWSDISITITISPGAVSGPLVVSRGPSMNDSNNANFAVTTQPLPAGWLDKDVGATGLIGSATYAGGTFTVSGAGNMGLTPDAFHFAYQPLSGDGTIVARVVSSQGVQFPEIGAMIRETLAADSSYALIYYIPNIFTLAYRASAGAGVANQSSGAAIPQPYWLKLARSGNTFRSYQSADGVYWTQVGTGVTISMASNVSIGLAVSGSGGTLETATFDNVAIAAGAPAPTPVITSVTPTSGGIGASVTITGSNFGALQGTSSVLFNGSPSTSVSFWNDTQIVAVVPSTATTGPLTVVANGIGSNRNFVFTFYNPVITSVTPPAGAIAGYITLNGSGFGATIGTSQVKFNGLAASISTWSDTSITAIVPANATTGPVTVTVGGVISNAVQFTVTQPVSITSISPNSGPIGGSVTITGTGFGPAQSNSIVGFYGANATTISFWSDTQIVAVVPAGAATGNVTVTVAGVTAQGPVFVLGFTAMLTDSLGNPTTYSARLMGGQWYPSDSQGSGCSSCTMRGTIHNTYDSRGNVLATTDALGHVTSYTYDTSNNLLSQTVQVDATNTATTSYTYNSFGEVLTVTDALGHVTTNAYDAKGNLLSVTSPAPGGTAAASVTNFAYDLKGELTQITDPLGHITTMTYTPAGLIASITDAAGNVTSYQYDARGNRTAVIDPLLKQTSFAYDAGSRLTTITYPDATTTTFAYDSRGRRTSVTDQNAKTSTYVYDDADRLTSVTDAANNVTTYAYDTENNLVSITDASLHTTTFTYDAFGRVTRTNFPSVLSENYAYDANNNLTSKTDRKNQTIVYVYDALNRLTQKTYPDTTSANYVYDLVGKIQQVNDPTGTYAFAYDNMGRLVGTTTSYSFLTGRSFTASYAYDAASNRTGFTDPEGGATAYAYDALNRVATLTPPAAFSGTGAFGFSYDALSRRTQMTRPNGLSTLYAYDSLSRLQSVLHQAGASTIDGASYTVDAAGNRTSKADRLAGVTSNYTYDLIYQLTGVTQGANTTESYSYDAVGNRLSSLGASPYAYNVSNQLTAKPGASYTYDANGNTVNKTDASGATAYAWDFENRLTSVTLPGAGGTVTFKYDPFGRRIYKSSLSGTSVFAYDGDNLVEETNAAGGVVARYSQGLNIDEPLAMLRGAATTYYHADGLDSVTSLTSAAGALAQTYTYDSFGKLTASAGSLTNPFQYTARESDAETGLYYYRARYYDPSAGRFLNEDPLEFGGKNVNFYQYANNNPTRFVDPSGFSIICPFTNPACRASITRHLSDCAKKVLSPYFPGMNLDAIELVSELPGFANMAPIDVGAITVGNIISYQPGFFAGDAGGLAALGHELTHVKQQSAGFLPFLKDYVHDYLRNLINGNDSSQAYEKIRAEKEANAIGNKIFDDLFRKHGLRDICKNYCQ